MRGLAKIPTLIRAAAYLAVATAIAATALQFRRDYASGSDDRPASVGARDPLASELARCQAMGIKAKDDAWCEAVWAENRRRFFHPESSTGAHVIEKPAAEPGER